MPASTLYSAHILPNRPAYIPKEQREDVVVGKSEWKKVSKWFKEVGKEGLVKVKETKGEVTVVSYVPFSLIMPSQSRVKSLSLAHGVRWLAHGRSAGCR